MRIGVCTSDFGTMKADELFRRVASHGFESTQLAFCSAEECGFTPDGRIEIPESVSDEAIAAILAAAKKHNVEILSVNGTFNMAHPDPAVRAEGVRRYEGFAEAVKKLGCKYASVCTGTRNPEHLWSPSPLNNTEEAWQDMLETMRAVVRIAERHGLILAIETEASNVVDTPEKARRVMDEVGSDSLKMIIDCANLFHAGEAHPGNVRKVMKHAFDVFGRDIVMAHGKDIAESDGIEFIATGQGIVDFPYFFELLKEYGYSGDMLLHGVFDEDLMSPAVALMKKYA